VKKNPEKVWKLTPPPGSSGSGGETGGKNQILWNRSSLALLGGFCLFLSTLEYLIPKPLPFMRIGLANLPLILALDLFPPGPFALLVLIKVSGQALITGTLASYVFVFSLAGSSVSALAMYSLRRLLGKNRISFTGLGICGAVLSNLVQLVLARLFVFGEGVRFLAPLFLVSGLISGAILGLFCETFAARSRWFRRARGEDGGVPFSAGPEASGEPDSDGHEEPGEPGRETRRKRRQEQWKRLFRGEDLFITGLCLMILFLCTPSLVFKTLQFLFFWSLMALSGKKSRPLTVFLVMLGVVFGNLLVPYGKLLAEWGPLKISQGALLTGLHRALTLEGLVLLSGTFIRADLRLPGAFGALLGESFRLFALLQKRKKGIRSKHVIEGIDRLMLELDQGPASGSLRPGVPESGGEGPVRRRAVSVPLLALMALVCAFLALADEQAFLRWASTVAGFWPGLRWPPDNWG
jgi:heptaprenyl diphosphate synthase